MISKDPDPVNVLQSDFLPVLYESGAPADEGWFELDSESGDDE